MNRCRRSDPENLAFRSVRQVVSFVGLSAFSLWSLILPAQAPLPSGRGSVVANNNVQTPQFATGPEVGQKIPAFRAPDQNGKMQDFNSIRGPKGAMIVFFRSADW